MDAIDTILSIAQFIFEWGFAALFIYAIVASIVGALLKMKLDRQAQIIIALLVALLVISLTLKAIYLPRVNQNPLLTTGK